MEEFTDMDIDLNSISNEVIQSFGERFSMDATRLLNTQIILPGDGHMINLALAIALGLYMKNLVDGEYNERTIN